MNSPLYSFSEIGETWLNNNGGTKSTMGIRGSSRVRKRGKISLNQALIYAHPFPPLSPRFFLFAPSQISSQKTVLRCKKILVGGRHLLPVASPSYAYILKKL